MTVVYGTNVIVVKTKHLDSELMTGDMSREFTKFPFSFMFLSSLLSLPCYHGNVAVISEVPAIATLKKEPKVRSLTLTEGHSRGS